MLRRSRKPLDFIIIGAQKSGTSALEHYLRNHPKIGMGKVKELHFFDDEEVFSKRNPNYSHYENQVERREGNEIFGECTPAYLYWDGVARRIWEYNPMIKLIAILRNPAERAFSQWKMNLEYNWDTEDFLTCLQNERQRCREALPYQHVNYSYVDRGYYSYQIRQYRKFFTDDQLLFIKYEDFAADQKGRLRSVLRYLGLDDKHHFDEEEIFKSSPERNMTEEEKKFLWNAFAHEIDEVERLLNWNCSDWKSSIFSHP